MARALSRDKSIPRIDQGETELSKAAMSDDLAVEGGASADIGFGAGGGPDTGAAFFGGGAGVDPLHAAGPEAGTSPLGGTVRANLAPHSALLAGIKSVDSAVRGPTR